MKTPTIKECYEWSNNMEQSTLFFHHFESNGWKVGRNPMKSWKSALSGWIKRNESKQTKVEKAVSNNGIRVVDKFWKRMSQVFGSKWVSSYGTEPTKPWIDVISNLSNEKIAFGLNEMLRQDSNWPPDLRQFYSLCRSYRKPIKALNTPDRKAILHQRDRTQSARLNAMNQIRGMVG